MTSRFKTVGWFPAAIPLGGAQKRRNAQKIPLDMSRAEHYLRNRYFRHGADRRCTADYNPTIESKFRLVPDTQGIHWEPGGVLATLTLR